MQRNGAHWHWWDNVVPLLILAAGLTVQAPLEQRGYALAGALICAVAARIMLAMWRRSGPSHFRESLRTRPRADSESPRD